MSTYDPALLQVTGMDIEYDFIFRTIGRESVWNINEQGSKLLTTEFLCTLQLTDTEVKFRLFGKEILFLGRSLVCF